MNWEPIIGLEIHAQLNTKSKLFSSAPNRFGDAPNTNITAACVAEPGTLPVLNKEAVRKAVQFGLAVNATINLISRFDRKSYFYPDTPRNFQITQHEKPLLSGGSVEIETEQGEKVVAIRHTHLEDDAAILKHFSDHTGVDFNRAGAPLIEVVSEPCLYTAKEASAFAYAIRTILIYLNASDCNMEEGSFRIDANISVKQPHETHYRSKVEIKNINSFSFMEMAIEKEIARQISIYESEPSRLPEELISPSTYRWDHEKKENVLMRKKRSAEDYRFFPEPDLAPIILTQQYIDSVRHTLPELPKERRRRYKTDLDLSDQIAKNLINHKPLCDAFEAALPNCTNPRLLANWMCIEFAGRLKEQSIVNIPPRHIAKLVTMIDEKKVTGPIAKKVADEMVKNPNLNPEILVQNQPEYHPIIDEQIIGSIIDEIMLAHPQTVQDFLGGKHKAFEYLIGKVMEKTKGRAYPHLVTELLRKKLSDLN